MKDPVRFSKKGWDSITQCCQLAAKDGWEHVWIGTRCIDKDNQSELSKAINFMFKYYKDASICYPYLEDISEVDIEGITVRLDTTFEKSRW